MKNNNSNRVYGWTLSEEYARLDRKFEANRWFNMIIWALVVIAATIAMTFVLLDKVDERQRVFVPPKPADLVAALSVMDSLAPKPMLAEKSDLCKPGAVRKVKRGETLSLIAKECWGSVHGWRHIYAANRAVISNPHRIKAVEDHNEDATVLVMPERPDAKPVNAPAGTTVAQRKYSVPAPTRPTSTVSESRMAILGQVPFAPVGQIWAAIIAPVPAKQPEEPLVQFKFFSTTDDTWERVKELHSKVAHWCRYDGSVPHHMTATSADYP